MELNTMGTAEIISNWELEKEINLKILNITMSIQDEYPELSEYLGEMPVTIPNSRNPQINNKSLSEYYDSLYSLLRNYVREHAH